MVMEKVTRFEVIDENGRAYTRWGVDVELGVQDDGKTLKVFIKHNPEKSKALSDNPPKPFGDISIEDVIKLIQNTPVDDTRKQV